MAHVLDAKVSLGTREVDKGKAEERAVKIVRERKRNVGRQSKIKK